MRVKLEKWDFNTVYRWIKNLTLSMDYFDQGINDQALKKL